MLPSLFGSRNVVSMMVTNDFGVGAVTTVWITYGGAPSPAEHSRTESIRFDVPEIFVALQCEAILGFFKPG
jgi:hypothetical protein